MRGERINFRTKITVSKRDLKKYLAQMDAQTLSDQIIELYEKFPPVKTYYDFVFKPDEHKRLGEARQKIKSEYFPEKRKRARLRLSVAHKYLKHFETLGVDAQLRAELMAFNIETALSYTSKRSVKSEAFYKSITQSFVQWLTFLDRQALIGNFLPQIQTLADECAKQQWQQSDRWQSLAQEVSDLTEASSDKKNDFQ